MTSEDSGRVGEYIMTSLGVKRGRAPPALYSVQLQAKNVDYGMETKKNVLE